MNPQDPKYQQKSKAISSAEPNYFVHFAMRHPVFKDVNFNLLEIKKCPKQRQDSNLQSQM